MTFELLSHGVTEVNIQIKFSHVNFRHSST